RAAAEGSGRAVSDGGPDPTFVEFRGPGRACVTRGCSGRVPIYLARGCGWVAVATRLTDMALFAPITLDPDPLVLALWEAGHGLFPDNRTFFAGVTVVPRGHVALVRPAGWRLARYWDPRPDRLAQPSPEGRRDHAARLRALLVGALDA